MGSESAQHKRYDRQIRIWGANGQEKLEAARVALLNCGPTGSETLKNLVLGGIASFTVVDGNRVEPRDLGNNFLVEASGLGEPRAKVVTDLLKELNEGVSGSYVEEAPEALIEGNPGFFDNFDLVIATQMREPQLVQLDALCRAKGVMLLAARAYGLVGMLRASLAEHVIVESKPDTQVDDLRVARPWPELVAHAAAYDLDALDDGAHKHVPYVVLLLQALQRWRAQTGAAADALPADGAQRAAFKEALRSMRRVSPETGAPLDEENFAEALRAAFHAWTPPGVPPPEVARLLADERAAAPPPGGGDFWVLAAALKAFVDNEGEGALPLDGAIPDMTATTDGYLALQRVYRQRAERDAAAVEAHAARVLADVRRGASGGSGGGEGGSAVEGLGADAVRTFCKNARSLRCVRFRPLAAADGADGGGAGGGGGGTSGSSLVAALSEEGSAASASLYVLLQAADRFYAAHGRFPGWELGGDVEGDVAPLKAAAAAVLAAAGGGGGGGAAVDDDVAAEVARFGAAELHVVASVVGGVAAQEAIKLLTRQFVPFSGTLIYNAMASTTHVFDF